MIILSMTYDIVTPESAENGETEDRGFLWENIPYSFRETVVLIKDGGFMYPSCSNGIPNWLSTEGETDPHTGETETRSLHPNNDPKSLRYWKKACRAAGLLSE